MAKKKSGISTWNDWIAFALLSLIWGTSFILIKKSLIAFDSTQVASLRIFIATITFLPIFIYYRKKIDYSRWYLYLLVGLAGGGIPAYLFALAQTKVSSSLAGALNTLTPIFTLIMGVIIFKNKVAKRKIAGMILGLSGAAIIFYLNNEAFEGGGIYSLLILIAAVFYALNVNMVKKFFNNHDPVALTAASFVFFGLFTIIPILKSDFLHVMNTNPYAWKSLGAVTVLSIFSTVLATVLFFKLVQKSNAVFASSVSFAIPLVALMWGILDGEKFETLHFLSLVLILTGVYLSRFDGNTSENKIKK